MPDAFDISRCPREPVPAITDFGFVNNCDITSVSARLLLKDCGDLGIGLPAMGGEGTVGPKGETGANPPTSVTATNLFLNQPVTVGIVEVSYLSNGSGPSVRQQWLFNYTYVKQVGFQYCCSFVWAIDPDPLEGGLRWRFDGGNDCGEDVVSGDFYDPGENYTVPCFAGSCLGHRVMLCPDLPPLVPSVCGGSCSEVPAALILTVSGLTGDCAALNGTYTLSNYGNYGESSCDWILAEDDPLVDTVYAVVSFQSGGPPWDAQMFIALIVDGSQVGSAGGNTGPVSGLCPPGSGEITSPVGYNLCAAEADGLSMRFSASPG